MKYIDITYITEYMHILSLYMYIYIYVKLTLCICVCVYGDLCKDFQQNISSDCFWRLVFCSFTFFHSVLYALNFLQNFLL